MEDSEFVDSLPKPLRENYSREIKAKLNTIEAEFYRNRDTLEKLKRQAIEIDGKHRALINMSVAPAVRGKMANIGYKLVRFSPLAECGCKNFDFLLYKKSGNHGSMVIFGECKSSISDMQDVISQLDDRKKDALLNLEYMKTNYLDSRSDDDLATEFVLSVYESDANTAVNEIASSKKRYVIWQCPLTSADYLRLAEPPSMMGDERHLMLPMDKELSILMKRPIPSNRRIFTFFEQGEMYSKLEALIYFARIGESGHIINKDDLIPALEKDFFYQNVEFLEEQARSLLKKGEEIGFLEWQQKESAYKIKAQGNRAQVLANSLLTKWLAYQLNKDLEKKKNLATLELRESYRKNVPRLEEFETRQTALEPGKDTDD